MPGFPCPFGCGADISADDDEGMVQAAHGHFTEVHAELGLTEMSVRNYFDAADRLTGSTERLDKIGDVEIRPTGPANVEDVIAFFDHDAFAGNPGWASCYCLYHHVDRSPGLDEWGMRSAQQNRTDLAARLADRSTWGWVAYVDGKVGGWVNASPRSAFPDHAVGGSDDDTTGAIVCFIIAPPYRRHGLGARLLAAACDGLREAGMTVAEAYPAIGPGGDAQSYPGPLSLYLEAGFERVDGGNERQGVARKELA
jgi:GNAT superfamily N-acetyltransferase